jgi:hypothetical protein
MIGRPGRPPFGERAMTAVERQRRYLSKPRRPPKGAWLKLKDAPLNVVGYVYSPDPGMKGRTDCVGVVHQYQGGERFGVAQNIHGYKFTHWHPLLAPPETK